MQGILGTSSKKPLFYVTHQADTIDIFFGMAKLMTIPNDRGHIIFKSTIAILYNAGVRAKDLADNFNLTYKSVVKYANAFLNAKDESTLFAELRNPGRSRYKLTDEIFNYIHERADYYCSLGKIRFHKSIIFDVESKFDKRFSRSKIRFVLNGKKVSKVPEKNVIDRVTQNTDGSDFDSVPIKFNEYNDSSVIRNRHCGLLLLSSYLSLELDLRPKRFYNTIKLLARNIMEKGAQDFLQTYKNLRDYQKIFHILVSSAGEIEISGERMYIKLDPFGRKSFRKKCNGYFEEFNKKAIRTVDQRYVLQLKKFSI